MQHEKMPFIKRVSEMDFIYSQNNAGMVLNFQVEKKKIFSARIYSDAINNHSRLQHSNNISIDCLKL